VVHAGGFEEYFEALIEAARRAGGIPAEPELASLGVAHGSIPVTA
jgi:hypothetical protein